MHRVNFTESQIVAIQSIKKQAYDKGFIWGIIYSILTLLSISLTVYFIGKYWYLFTG